MNICVVLTNRLMPMVRYLSNLILMEIILHIALKLVMNLEVSDKISMLMMQEFVEL